MTQSLITIAYIAASALFIQSLGGLVAAETGTPRESLRHFGNADRAVRDGSRDAVRRDCRFWSVRWCRGW
jgi:hypothetical protein